MTATCSPLMRNHCKGYEDRSVTSTITVEQNMKSFRSQQASFPTKKYVRFNLESNYEYDDKQPMYIEDFEAIWYQTTDFKVFRHIATNDVRIVVALDQNDPRPNSFRRIMERVYEACCEGNISLIVKEDQSELCRLMRNLDRLGLERLSVKRIRSDRNRCKKEAVAVILENQDDKHDGRYPSDQLMRVTQCDALFSHVMAATLAAALAHD